MRAPILASRNFIPESCLCDAVIVLSLSHLSTVCDADSLMVLHTSPLGAIPHHDAWPPPLIFLSDEHHPAEHPAPSST